jgi:phosphoesterase RecJ-like protein
MTYPESQQILDHITKANRILLNCHSSPDADSVGSALAMYAVLTYLNKTVEIVCPNEIPSSLRFLQNSHLIQVVDYSSFDFSSFDLFITMDSSSWNRVSGNQTVPQPNVPIIVIDHHKTNDHFGIINLIQPRISANCELLYYLFADWNMTDTYFDSVPDYYNSIAEPLLTGILGDTGSLRFPEADQHTFKVASYLLGFADKNKIIRNLYQSYSLDHIYFWSKIMSMMKKEASGNFVWASIPFSIYEEYAHLTSAKK